MIFHFCKILMLLTGYSLIYSVCKLLFRSLFQFIIVSSHAVEEVILFGIMLQDDIYWI